MRARERGRWDSTRKRNMEGEMRRFGQAVGEIDPGWGNVEGCQIVGGNMNQRTGAAADWSVNQDLLTGRRDPSGGDVGGGWI
jgi:hypothetical protein